MGVYYQLLNSDIILTYVNHVADRLSILCL